MSKIEAKQFYLRIDQVGAVGRKKLASQPGSLLVCQRQFGLTKVPFIRTVGFNSCVIATFYDPLRQRGAIAHFDLGTDVERSFSEIVRPRLIGDGANPKHLQARLFGGMFDQSNRLRAEIRNELQAVGRKIRIVEIDIPTQPTPGLIMNNATGEVFTLARPERSTPAELEQIGEALLYISTANRLLLDVSRAG
jgi:chemotaxis receptor (MCP) glutamine deamidase CheD